MAETEAMTKDVGSPLSGTDRKKLYQVSRFLDLATRKRLGLTIPIRIQVEDPLTGTEHKELDQEEIHLRWEPSIGTGPTSARLAVVDYDGDTGTLRPPAVWDKHKLQFLTHDNRDLSEAAGSPECLQVNAWATVQQALEFYEDPRALGRPIPWSFDGNRLMIVPQAGYRENAFYNRSSKSLQLYYYGDLQKPSYTSLSHDILAHETGHALLDGIRPCFLENSSWETPAFHEFVGDMTAILLSLRENSVRGFVERKFGTDLEHADFIAGLAAEFGRNVNHRPFLRTALNPMTFAEAQQDREAHTASQVLTGAMFDILKAVAKQYLSSERQAERKAAASPANALWWAIERMWRLALQPLDLLPPADVRFLDYARAMLRVDELNDPEDPHAFRKLIRQVLHLRGLCPQEIEQCEAAPKSCALTVEEAPKLHVFHDLVEASRSRTAAYRLVNDNRDLFGIPDEQDFSIADVYECNKLDYSAKRLPRHLVIQYLWREDVKLDEARFGSLRGETVHMLCGGTLVFDDRSNLLWWTAKWGRGTANQDKMSDRAKCRAEQGEKRRQELLEHIAGIVASRRLTLAEEPVDGGLTGRTEAVVAHREGNALLLESALHLCGGGERDEEWTTSF
ncbi:MAG TPA: hypothetical protein VKY89_18415 [Thermoanaerobaculia bacterium]|nr:hypothetical protein [Thermoanaerobaculia bacterium]